MEIDFDSYAALAQGDDDIHVDLDENDFSDPHLLVSKFMQTFLSINQYQLLFQFRVSYHLLLRANLHQQSLLNHLVLKPQN